MENDFQVTRADALKQLKQKAPGLFNEDGTFSRQKLMVGAFCFLK